MWFDLEDFVKTLNEHWVVVRKLDGKLFEFFDGERGPDALHLPLRMPCNAEVEGRVHPNTDCLGGDVATGHDVVVAVAAQGVGRIKDDISPARQRGVDDFAGNGKGLL